VRQYGISGTDHAEGRKAFARTARAVTRVWVCGLRVELETDTFERNRASGDNRTGWTA